MIMKRWLVILASALIFCGNCLADIDWMTDYSAALAKARAEDKSILLHFTGSDWCMWCKRLKNEVFDQPEFQSFAKANLIMVEVDFPRSTELPPRQLAANQQLGSDFDVHGYPTVVVLNSKGVEVGRLRGY